MRRCWSGGILWTKNDVSCGSYMELAHEPLLVLDFGLDIVDGVRRLHLEGDGLPGEGLDEDLHLQMAWCVLRCGTDSAHSSGETVGKSAMSCTVSLGG